MLREACQTSVKTALKTFWRLAYTKALTDNNKQKRNWPW